jgi:uncharacterized membrane protein
MSILEKSRVATWVLLVLFSMGWGVAAGASFFGGQGVSHSVALFGILGNIALVVTVIAMHKEHPLSARRAPETKEQP